MKGHSYSQFQRKSACSNRLSDHEEVMSSLLLSKGSTGIPSGEACQSAVELISGRSRRRFDRGEEPTDRRTDRAGLGSPERTRRGQRPAGRC